MPEKKIVSLLAAGTEIVYALGKGDALVGRSHECDFPSEALVLPACSSVKFAPDLSSTEIDRKVKEILTEALSIYTVDKEMIRQLSPDVIITQTQCEVCAVSLKDVEDALGSLLDKNAEIISLSPNLLGDIFADIRNIARQLNVPEKGEEVIESLEERIDLIRHKLKFITERPDVFVVEWLSPLMVAGNWTPELVEIAGGVPIMAEKGRHSPFIDYESLRAADPDIIVVSPCGFSIERTMSEISLLLELPGWNALKAIKNNRFYIADGNHYFNRSGPRIVDTIEILAEIINPKQFIFGYEGAGWLKFEV
ncbi:cobalamin-binding protein [Hufsiella ginkgonis]|uniref:ABC transporter substrate-binding protein n=1 Tax=Hufsiella ginkgonis TaxID=2695274 RepID=A0A7K1Y1P8_9SPHI|nr:cobalamin-binding protein [Hufsiella ginkgonis]MXV17008.1 ABC transporter substrate-binding protein [Hufsiella ginkgonis]